MDSHTADRLRLGQIGTRFIVALSACDYADVYPAVC
jgi:hypothetical protein